MELSQQQGAVGEEILLAIAQVVHGDGHFADDVGVHDMAEINDPRDLVSIAEDVVLIHVHVNDRDRRRC